MNPIAQASTLAAKFYLESNIFQNEREEIFRKTWWPVAREEHLANPGSYIAREVAGEPLLITRDQDQVLRVFSRVCRHRAGTIGADQGGTGARMMCRYHGWTYDLRGQLQTCPEFEGVENFRKEGVHLPQFRLETWGGFIFVTLSPDTPPLPQWLGEMVPEVEQAGYDLSRYREVARREYVINCNWKVYVDNYLEGYHIPVAHPALMAELDYKKYSVHARRYHSFQEAPLRTGEPTPAQPRQYGQAGQADRTFYYWLFPHFMLNIYPDNMSANYVVPLSADRTLTVFEWYLPGTAHGLTPKLTDQEREKLCAFSHQVQLEDIELCEAVQRNLSSSTYESGRYSVKRENGVFHFHELYREFCEAVVEPMRAKV